MTKIAGRPFRWPRDRWRTIIRGAHRRPNFAGHGAGHKFASDLDRGLSDRTVRGWVLLFPPPLPSLLRGGGAKIEGGRRQEDGGGAPIREARTRGTPSAAASRVGFRHQSGSSLKHAGNGSGSLECRGSWESPLVLPGFQTEPPPPLPPQTDPPLPPSKLPLAVLPPLPFPLHGEKLSRCVRINADFIMPTPMEPFSVGLSLPPSRYLSLFLGRAFTRPRYDIIARASSSSSRLELFVGSL